MLTTSSLLVVPQAEPPLTMPPLAVAAADKFSPEHFLAALHRPTPSQLVAAALPPLLLLVSLPAATAEHQHLPLPRERPWQHPLVVAVDLRSPLVAGSCRHHLVGLAAAAVHGRHRFRMALPAQVVHLVKAAMLVAMELLQMHKLVAVVAVQVA